MSDKKYDVGILGVWGGCNYGSIATYYALNRIVTGMGYSVLMIDKPRISDKKDVEMEMTHSRRFAHEHYNISKSYRLQDLHELNNLCDIFMMGSDQVWNYGISKNFGKSYYFDFVEDTKKKIAYAVSFGHGVDFAPEEERQKISALMKRFDGISVREADGVKMCRDIYGVKATQVLDPVFLADRKIFDELADKSTLKVDEPYNATYILDPTPEKVEAMQYVSRKLGYRLVNMLDGLPWLYEENSKKLGLESVPNLQVEDWINCFRNSEFVITDSCHGASFALLYDKTFIPITNKRRGFSRFKSLADLFGFRDRLVTDPKTILENENLLKPMDYDKIHEILKSEKERCYNWMRNIFFKPKFSGAVNNDIIAEKPQISETPAVPAKPAAPATPAVSQDFARCKMLVTLLRDYGIKHVVLSSGSRNVNLVRLFEANSCFKTYDILDERSAAFFALGLSVQVNEPVVICCTSGTAASNYLTGITEAFYQQVPLIVVTADRYPCLLGQNEDQTIPQVGMYEKVVKKSVTLPVNEGGLGDWEARRLICEAILECNHHGKGPVHINVPIKSIERPVPPKEVLQLDKKFRKIERICLDSPKSLWDAKVNRLKSMNRILLVCGQNQPIDPEEKKLIEQFIEKYNCVAITDHLSNFYSDKAILSLPILRQYDNEKFNEFLYADIVLTIGGRRMLNDAILPRLRAQKKPLGHWRVAEDGLVADTYKKMSNVFECSSYHFFKYFVENAGDIKNNGVYYNAWKNAENSCVNTEHTDKYSELYAIERTVKGIPENSILHLGIGNTIMFANRFHLANNVQVFCNMGTNGIDGSASTFMGNIVCTDKLSFLLVGDLSFFYDLNSVWNKELTSNIRIMMFNNGGAGLLYHLGSPAISQQHKTVARAYVESLGFMYLSSHDSNEFNKNLETFLSPNVGKPIFYEVFTGL